MGKKLVADFFTELIKTAKASYSRTRQECKLKVEWVVEVMKRLYGYEEIAASKNCSLWKEGSLVARILDWELRILGFSSWLGNKVSDLGPVT